MTIRMSLDHLSQLHIYDELVFGDSSLIQPVTFGVKMWGVGLTIKI